MPMLYYQGRWNRAQGRAFASPNFGRSVNPIISIWEGGADYAHQMILAPPDFQPFLWPSNLMTLWIGKYNPNNFHLTAAKQSKPLSQTWLDTIYQTLFCNSRVGKRNWSILHWVCIETNNLASFRQLKLIDVPAPFAERDYLQRCT